MGLRKYDREPQPEDGPDYHADHAAWVRRQEFLDALGHDVVIPVSQLTMDSDGVPMRLKPEWQRDEGQLYAAAEALMNTDPSTSDLCIWAAEEIKRLRENKAHLLSTVKSDSGLYAVKDRIQRVVDGVWTVEDAAAEIQNLFRIMVEDYG